MNPWSGQSNSVAFSTVFDAKFWVKATLASRPDGGFRHPRHPGMQQYVWLLVPQTGTNCPKFGHLLMDYKPIHRAVHRIPKHCFDLCCSGVLLHVFQNKSMYEFFWRHFLLTQHRNTGTFWFGFYPQLHNVLRIDERNEETMHRSKF